MSRPYEKIDTLFDRSTDTFTVIEEQTRRAEFDFISHWLVTEKVDGTNIRLIFTRMSNGVDEDMVVWEVRGRSDRAEIPKPLLEVLESICDRIGLLVRDVMLVHDLQTYTLYGEGYGAGIQKGGYYRDDPAFILFDVRADDAYLGWEHVISASMNFEIDRVPLLENPYLENREWDGSPTLWTKDDIVRYVKTGDCLTTFAKEQREAEGIIAKSPVELKNARGQRVMFKLKGSDFRAGKR